LTLPEYVFDQPGENTSENNIASTKEKTNPIDVTATTIKSACFCLLIEATEKRNVLIYMLIEYVL